jgi:hypothetical protein
MSIDRGIPSKVFSLFKMAYNYVAISYSGLNVCLYYLDKNDESREISFYDVDSFVRKESKLRRISYLTLIGNQTIYIEDPTRLVAELVNINYGPFLLVDDYNWQRRFASHSKVEFHHHSEFTILYHADNFNRNGILKILKEHGFKSSEKGPSTNESMKNWLMRKCDHIFHTCSDDECDPDCQHYKYT